MFRKSLCVITKMTKNHLFKPLSVVGFASHPQSTMTSSCPNKIAQAKEKNLQAAQLLQLKYPHVLSYYNETGKIAYAVRGESPEEFIAAGGFHSRSDIWFANNGNGMNKGNVCFSLLPEVTILFLSHALHVSKQKKAFLYAVALHGNLFLAGGRFCQIISPGAFAVPTFWAAREVLGVNSEDQIQLSHMITSSDKIPENLDGVRFQEFCDNKLYKPAVISLGDDYDPIYNIEHTAETMKLQERVRIHY